MQFNLFSWIREGVKRSVMLGVADAIDHVGTPTSGQDLHNSLQNFMQNIETPLEPAAIGGGSGAKQPNRKRLGRSLRELDASKATGK
jgi:hypothetical protein